MAVWEVDGPDGGVYEIEWPGEQPPSQEELNSFFAAQPELPTPAPELATPHFDDAARSELIRGGMIQSITPQSPNERAQVQAFLDAGEMAATEDDALKRSIPSMVGGAIGTKVGQMTRIPGAPVVGEALGSAGGELALQLTQDDPDMGQVALAGMGGPLVRGTGKLAKEIIKGAGRMIPGASNAFTSTVGMEVLDRARQTLPHEAGGPDLVANLFKAAQSKGQGKAFTGEKLIPIVEKLHRRGHKAAAIVKGIITPETVAQKAAGAGMGSIKSTELPTLTYEQLDEMTGELNAIIGGTDAIEAGAARRIMNAVDDTLEGGIGDASKVARKAWQRQQAQQEVTRLIRKHGGPAEIQRGFKPTATDQAQRHAWQIDGKQLLKSWTDMLDTASDKTKANIVTRAFSKGEIEDITEFFSKLANLPKPGFSIGSAARATAFGGGVMTGLAFGLFEDPIVRTGLIASGATAGITADMVISQAMLTPAGRKLALRIFEESQGTGVTRQGLTMLYQFLRQQQDEGE